jgi:benzoyl-CoA reductase/2-hydroxyglutaryl-CoA dehydratase subunit BcrC/BadD/HgdB
MNEKKAALDIISDNYRKTAMLIKAGMPQAAKAFQITVDHFEEYRRRIKTGEPVAWINFAVPPELFWAMDIEPVIYDGLASQVARVGHGLEYIEIAEQYIPEHICSDNKVHIGMVLSGELPLPTVMVYPSSPCDSNRTALSALAEYAHIPTFVIDLPYFKNERSIQYVAQELKRLVSFLEEHTNRKLDMDKLKQVMEYSNLAHEYYLKLDKLKQAVPSPFGSMDMYIDGGPMIAYTGLPELVDYYKTRVELAKEKVARKEGHLADEKLRVVWTYGVYVPDLTVYKWLEEKYGAVSVMCMNFNFVVKPTQDLSNLDSILRGLAEKTTLMPMNREVHGPIENFIDATLDLCRRNKADCAIMTGHVACKSNWAAMKLIKDTVEEELGIPMLAFEVDLFDPRLINPDGVRAKLEEFFETIVIPNAKKRKEEAQR